MLVLASIVTAIRAYPNYFPYLNILSMGRPGYTLVNDSNLDWNHALPEVESFVRQRGLKQVLLDEYGFCRACGVTFPRRCFGIASNRHRTTAANGR